jgi:hypothetical protein
LKIFTSATSKGNGKARTMSAEPDDRPSPTPPLAQLAFDVDDENASTSDHGVEFQDEQQTATHTIDSDEDEPRPATSMAAETGASAANRARTGRPLDSCVWHHFVRTNTATAKKGATCKYCKSLVRNAQPSRNMVPHLAKCKAAGALHQPPNAPRE